MIKNTWCINAWRLGALKHRNLGENSAFSLVFFCFDCDDGNFEKRRKNKQPNWGERWVPISVVSIKAMIAVVESHKSYVPRKITTKERAYVRTSEWMVRRADCLQCAEGKWEGKNTEWGCGSSCVVNLWVCEYMRVWRYKEGKEDWYGGRVRSLWVAVEVRVGKTGLVWK